MNTLTLILRCDTRYMKKTPYYIIEVANTHGGNRQYLDDLIAQFSDLTGNFGIKFQAFSPDTIATKDFEDLPMPLLHRANESEWFAQPEIDR